MGPKNAPQKKLLPWEVNSGTVDCLVVKEVNIFSQETQGLGIDAWIWTGEELMNPCLLPLELD